MGEDISESYPCWRVFYDRAANQKERGIKAVLVSESGQHNPIVALLQFDYTKNMEEYKACIFCLEMAIDMDVHEILVITD